MNRKPVSNFLLVINTDILSRNVSKLSQLIVKIFDIEFLSHPLGDLGVTYDVHCKACSGLPISVKLFSLGVTAEALRAIIG